MKRKEEVKELLIANTIRLISEGGFENATTKALTHCEGVSPETKINEVYIYRLFGSKEELYDAAFMCLDNELFIALKNAVESVGGLECCVEERLYELFLMAWRFMLSDEARCRCYIRYYYSIYFKGKTYEGHKRCFNMMLDSFSPLFKEEAEVYAIMHSVFTMLLDFAIRVYNGEIEDNEINRPHVFNVLYCMMVTYFKDPETVS